MDRILFFVKQEIIDKYELAKVIQAYAAERSLSQAQLASKLGMQTTSTERLLQGDRKLGLLEWVHMCDKLQIDPNEFMEKLRKY